MLKKAAIAVAAVGMIVGLYLGTRHDARLRKQSDSANALSAAPAITLVDLRGNKVDAAARGKVILINFWAAWCTPCAQEIPKFVAFQNKYGGDGFQIIGISMEDKESALREFYRKYNMNYPVVVGNESIAHEYGGILGLPTSFLISRDGRMYRKYAGVMDYSDLEHDIVTLLRANR